MLLSPSNPFLQPLPCPGLPVWPAVPPGLPCLAAKERAHVAFSSASFLRRVLHLFVIKGRCVE